MTRHFIFIGDNTAEEKVTNIIVSSSQLDEVLSLWLTNHFFKLNDTAQNEKDRDDFEKFILNDLSYRKKCDIVSKLIVGKSGVDKFKSDLYMVGEIRNKVAHKTGFVGIPNNIDALYKEFDEIMHRLEKFIEITYHEFQRDMDYAYMHQYSDDGKKDH